MSTERHLVEMSPRTGVQLRDIDSLYRFAVMISKSKMYKQWETPEQIAVAVQMGLEIGFTPVRSLWAFYAPPGGVPALRGEAVLAKLRASGMCETLDVGSDDVEGWISFKRRDDVSAHRVTYTIEEAKQVGLDAKWENARAKGGKATNNELLLWRAVARAGRRYFSDVLHGIAILEESRDWHDYDAAPGPTGAPERPKLEAPRTPDPLFAEGSPEPAEEVAVEATTTKPPDSDSTGGCPNCESTSNPVEGRCPDCGFPDDCGFPEHE